MPARSSASQAVSRRSRCCGSIASASRGPMPKKPASNWSASCRKPPSLTYVVPGWSGSGSYKAATSHPRFTGNGEMASVPSVTSRHRSSGVLTPPGNRQLIATMAIGSSAPAATGAVCTSRASDPGRSSAPCRYSTTASIVARSKSRVIGNGSPVAVTSRLRTSTAATESSPSSLNDRRASLASRTGTPRTALTWEYTSSVSHARCPSAGRAASFRRSRSAGPPSPTVADPAAVSAASAPNGYVGSRIRRAPEPWNTALQSTVTPRTCSSARDRRKVGTPGWCRRREPTTVACALSPSPSSVSWTPASSTGCGLTSTNVRWPAASRARVACSNRISRVMLRCQYGPSRPTVSWRPPVREE